MVKNVEIVNLSPKAESSLRVVQEDEVKCSWCVQTNFACTGAEVCDFKLLPKEKNAIIERMTKEASIYNDSKAKLTNMADMCTMTREKKEELVRDMLDRLFGIMRMTEALEKEFGMSRDEIEKVTNMKKISMMDKIKLATELKRLKSPGVKF